MNLSIQAISHTLPYFASSAGYSFSQPIFTSCNTVCWSTAELIKRFFLDMPLMAPIMVGLLNINRTVSVLAPTFWFQKIAFSSEMLRAEGQHELADKQEKIEKVIRNFAETNGCKYAFKISVYLCEESDPGASLGINSSWGGPVIILNREQTYLDEMGLLTPFAQSIIAHELTHIDKKHSLWSLARAIAASIVSTCIALHFCSCLFPTISFIALTIFADSILQRVVLFARRAQEQSADAAIGTFIKDPKQALKAIQAAKRCCEYIRGEIIKLNSFYDMNSSLNFNNRLNSFRFTKTGEDRFDFVHPSYSERIAFFEKEEKRLRDLLPSESISWYQTIKNRIGKLQLGR